MGDQSGRAASTFVKDEDGITIAHRKRLTKRFPPSYRQDGRSGPPSSSDLNVPPSMAILGHPACGIERTRV